MLNFDEPRYLAIQSGALGLADGIEAAIATYLEAGASNLFFLGTGGAAILMQPAHLLLSRHSSFPAFLEQPAELVLSGHAHLSKDSIVVIPSLSGTTKESIAALAYCRAIGAKIIVLTGHADSPLAKDADQVFVNFAEDDTSCESFYLQSLILALAILRQRGEMDQDGAIRQELLTLPPLLLAAKAAFEPAAAELAAKLAAKPYHILTGAGAMWPQAFYYGMCILEEMQWIKTRPVHAADFFHGTLELVEEGVSVILMKGEDVTRPVAQRVEDFVPGHGGDLIVLDTASVDLPGISSATRGLIGPVIMAALLERASAHLEVLRDHPLTTRRYYRRIAY